ncbi:DNA polymerase Y family protein [bacterium]|nr:DNA polymerase Y family protein [bacterium]
MRIACLHVLDVPLAAWLRADPELRGGAVAIADGATPRARIVAVSATARGRGVDIGMTAAQAQAIASDLTLRAASVEAERAAQAALGDVAYSFSPRVEDGAPGTVWFDAGGLGERFASERELAQAALRRAAALGLEAAIGIAGSKVSAELAARGGGGCAVVPASEEWRVLAPLSLDLLAPPPRLRATLRRWGIRTLGDLAALPASALATRLGPEAAALARRARGEDAHPLAPRPLPLQFEEVAELEWGVDALEPFLFVVRGLLDRLLARLAVRGLVCGDLRLSLGLADRGRDERTVTVAAPSNALKALLTLVRVHLEARPPRAAVEIVRLAAVPERLRAAQLDLFRPAGPPPAQLAATLARLGALCGDAAVGAPQVADSHRPDAYGVAPFAAPTGAPASTPAPLALPLALRAVRPPRPLEVFCQRDQPEFVRGDACQGRVVSLAGPWRLAGDWWRPGDLLQRDYYDAHLTDGGVYRLYFDYPANGWFLDGVYD